jgi:two-component system, OmpR family, phosphate regulon sensor histidine kinase PhoR
LFKSTLSPSKISFISATTVWLILLGVLLFEKWEWYFSLLLATLISSIIFFTVQYLINKYVDERLDILYRYIYKHQPSKRQQFFDKTLLPNRTITEAQQDIEAWSKQQDEEITKIKANEQYRKEFLQNLGHELKTPLFAIQGYVETLLDEKEDFTETQIVFLEHANRNVARLTGLMKDLDVITKMETGSLQLQIHKFNLRNSIKPLVTDFEKDLNAKQITLSKNISDDIQVLADEQKIKQVITNLVDNAIKYGKRNGQITINCFETDGKHVLIEIADDGIGLSSNQLSRVFERFYRTDEARLHSQGGTGLGLAICKHIIEAHNQQIHVRSTPSVGTTFGFTLPIA